MNPNTRVAVIHPDRQHSLRTALSLKKNNITIKYITTIFDRDKSLTSKLKFLLSKKYKNKLKSHQSDILEDTEILQFCEMITLFSSLFSKIVRIKFLAHIVNEFRISIFNNRVFKYLKRNPFDAVIIYDTLAGKLSSNIKKKLPNTKVIIDMSAPYYPFMVDIFMKEIEFDQKNSQNLKKELSTIQHKMKLKRSFAEIKSADSFLVASNFTKNSLMFYGADEEKIYYARYGIENADVVCSETFNLDILNLIYIGNFNQKKGINHMLDVIEQLPSDRISLTIIGSYIQEYKKFTKFKNKYKFTGHIPKNEVLKYLDFSDIMIFPSLADGFGFAALEAMSRSVPVICSRNAGISDLIIDKYNGFLIDPFNNEELKSTLLWIVNNRDKMSTIKINAKQTALKITWKQYEDSIHNAILKIINN